MKSMLLLISVIILIVHTEQQLLNCTKADQRRADVVFSKLFTIGDPNRKFPSNQLEAHQYCSETRELLKQAENYTKKCLKELPKQMSSIFIYTIKNMANQICKPGSKRLQGLLTAAPCINGADNELNRCIQNADNKLKVPYFCCQIGKFEECMQEKLRSFVICTDDHREHFKQFFDSLLSNILDLVCAEYNSSDKCSNLSATPNKTKQQRRTKSFFAPIIDIFDSFPLI